MTQSTGTDPAHTPNSPHEHGHHHPGGHEHGRHQTPPGTATRRAAVGRSGDLPRWDVIVVGGASAGLSAALVLGRARRATLVVDSGHPRNEVTAHMHGVLGHDGLVPGDLYAAGRAEIEAYGVEVVQDEVVEITGAAGDFTVVLRSGATEHTRQVIVATGLRDELPPIPGLAEQWGRGAFVCPYCDGYERRDAGSGCSPPGS